MMKSGDARVALIGFPSVGKVRTRKETRFLVNCHPLIYIIILVDAVE